MFKIKICGVTNLEDARAVADSSADAIGINFYTGSKRYVDDDLAKTICKTVDGKLLRVGVFVNEDANRIAEVIAHVGLDAIQLHGDEPPAFLRDLPDQLVIRAFQCKDGDLTPVSHYLEMCARQGIRLDAILLDAFDRNLRGGTGRTIDLQSLDGEIEKLRKTDWVLAGGLTPENVSAAIRTVRPMAVDTASGVEDSPRRKNHASIRSFAANALAAFEAELRPGK